MNLRPATIHDAELLVSLHTPDSVRTNVTVEGTREWIQKNDQNRILFIVEQDGKAIGTVRADLREGKYELSYALLPAYRGKRLGWRMVFEFIYQYLRYEPLRAIIKKGNIASERIAKWFRLQPQKEEGDFIYWESDRAIQAI